MQATQAQQFPIPAIRPKGFVPSDPVVRKSLIFLALFHLLLWTLVPSLAHVSPSLDLVEGFAWGSAWQAGYFKHPPLSPWLTAISAQVFGKNLFAMFVLSPLAILVTLACVWSLSREFFDEKASAVGLYLVSAQLYFNLLTPEFNHNVMQIPLWAAAFLFYWRAVTRGRLVDYLVLGLVLGLCTLAKYSAVLLYAVLGAFTLLRPDLWRRIKLLPLLACVVVATAAAGPNIVWQVTNDFPSVKYAQARMGDPLSLTQRLSMALKFVAAQLVTLLPLLIAAFTAGRRTARDTSLPPLAHAYVLNAAFAPAVLVLTMILLGGNAAKTMWGMPMFTCIGLAALLWLGQDGVARLASRKWWRAWTIAVIVFALLYAVMVRLGPIARNHVSRALFPGPQIAQELERDWNARTNAPLRYVVGEVWHAGNVAFFAQQTPAVFIEASTDFSPWIAPARLQECGALFIWQQRPGQSERPAWLKAYPSLPAPTVKRFAVPGHDQLQVEMVWAILPPQQTCGNQTAPDFSAGK